MGYGFGFYHDKATSSVGVWFGFGQIQLSRWQATLLLFRDYSVFPDGYARHWIGPIGWDAD